MAALSSQFPLDFFTQKPLEVKFSQLDLSSDAGLLLVRQAEEQLKICERLAACLTDEREQAKVKHPLSQLISQRVYQIAAGYEDANESYSEPPKEILLDIDGWDALTHGHQQLSLFNGYYGHHIYFPVLINEAEGWLPISSPT